MKDWIQIQVSELKIFFKLFLPKNKKEYFLLLGLAVFYLSYSLYIIFHSSIIDNVATETDLYFSFDNPLILKYGNTYATGHPLLKFFYYPFVLLGNLINTFAGLKAKTVLFVLLSSTLISMSCVYINRYLKEIVEIKDSISLLITLFFAFFSTNLILAFTPESFTLSLFFLSFTVYYYSSYIKEGKTPTFFISAVIANIILGGITITNAVKGFIPNLFLHLSWKKIFKRLIGLGIIFILVLLLLEASFQLILGRSFFLHAYIHQGMYTIGDLSLSTILYYAFVHFWGTPVFFTDLTHEIWTKRDGTIIPMIVCDHAHYWWQYAFFALLLITLIIAFVRNYKNKFVQMLFLFFFTDIFLHIVLKFGLTAPFIYGGHWVYCIPLVLGWLYKSLNGKLQKGYIIFLAAMFAILIINNLYHLSDFISLAIMNFPTVQ